jgi:hypothetical protein
VSWYVGLFTHPTKPSARKDEKQAAQEAKDIEAKELARLRRDQFARLQGAATLGAGRPGTVLTGQGGAAGQPAISVPTLLGR